jgi:hypothetical protein
MTDLKETLIRDAVATEAAERTRFGHDPREQTYTPWGEDLDDAWGAEFDRRLAAWEAESTAPAPARMDHESFAQPR